MPRGRPKKVNKVVEKPKKVKSKPLGRSKKSKVVDHNLYRVYILAQQLHVSEKFGYVEEVVFLFGKDEDMVVQSYDPGTYLKSKNFIAVPKGLGKNIRKLFSDMKDFKGYLKEIDAIIL